MRSGHLKLLQGSSPMDEKFCEFIKYWQRVASLDGFWAQFEVLRLV